jgi:hypothetical protein
LPVELPIVGLSLLALVVVIRQRQRRVHSATK